MFTAILAAITAALQAIPELITLGGQLVAAYQAHVKILYAQSLQEALQPIEAGGSTDAQKAAAAKAVADAIAHLS